MRRSVMLLVPVAALAAGLAGCKKADMETQMAGATMMADSANYTIVFHSRWTRDNFPLEYPSANPVTGPHFSGIIGATHNASYTLFADGAMPTPGIEALSEMGRHSPLDAEIRAAMAAGTAGTLFESGGLRDHGDSLVVNVTVDRNHPMVSLAAMIAPSPDWFTGATNINLMENDNWVASRTVELNAWDSGGDDGTTYKAADRDTNPKKPTMRATNEHFVSMGSPAPVATITITRR